MNEKKFIQITFLVLILLSLSIVLITKTNASESAINVFFRLYKDDRIDLIKLEPATGTSYSSDHGDYTLKVISFSNTSETKFFTKYFYNQTGGTPLRTDEIEFFDMYLVLPYYQSGKIQIYHLDKLLLEKEFNFSPACGNNVCESGETTSCPQDCKPTLDVCGNKICESGETSENCPQDCPPATTSPTSKVTRQSNFLWFLFIGLILALVFVGCLASLRILRSRKKSQSSLLVLVVIIAIFSILFFSSQYSNVSLQKSGLKDIELSKIITYLDELKGFSRQSALLASHAAAKDVALKGGSNSSVTWIKNFDRQPPAVGDVRYFLGTENQAFLNKYMKNLYIEDFLNISYSNFTCSNVDVSEDSVNSGSNDEKYNTGNFGSSLAIRENEEHANSTNDISTETSQVRFWYLYRKFKDWTYQTTLPQDIFECVRNEFNFFSLVTGSDNVVCDYRIPPSLRACVEAAANKASQDLNKTFSDPYVEVGYNINCFCAGVVYVDCHNLDPRPTTLPCAKNDRPAADELCGNIIITNGIERQPLQQVNKTKSPKKIFDQIKGDRYLKFIVDTNFDWLLPCAICGHEGEPSPEIAIGISFYALDQKYALSVP